MTIRIPSRSRLATALREPNLLVPREKPTANVKLKRNFLTEGLSICLPVLYGKQVFDFAQNKAIPIVGNTALNIDHISLDGSGDYLNVGPASLVQGQSLTIITRTKNDSTSNNTFIGCSNGTLTSDDRVNIHLPFSGVVYWDFGVIDDGGRLSVSNTISTTEYVDWQFIADSGGYMEIRKNSASLASTSSGDSTGFAGSSNNFHIGRFNNGGTPPDYPGDIQYFYVWKRRLSSSEIELIRNNPYILFEPANDAPFIVGTAAAGTEITVPQGDLALSSTAPTVGLTTSAEIAVPQANLVLSATAPTVQLGASVTVEPPSADLALSAVAPTVLVSANVDISVPAADLSLNTTAPTVQAGDNVAIDVPQADLALSTQAPIVAATDNQQITVPQADLSLTTDAPSVIATEAGQIIVPTADLLLSTVAPSVSLSANVAIEIPQADLSLSTTAPTAGISWNIVVPQSDLSLSTTAPSVLQGFNIFVPSADLSLSATAPTVQTTAAANISIPQGNLALTGFAPSISATGVDIWTEITPVSTVWTEIT